MSMETSVRDGEQERGTRRGEGGEDGGGEPWFEAASHLRLFHGIV